MLSGPKRPASPQRCGHEPLLVALLGTSVSASCAERRPRGAFRVGSGRLLAGRCAGKCSVANLGGAVISWKKGMDFIYLGSTLMTEDKRIEVRF